MCVQYFSPTPRQCSRLLAPSSGRREASVSKRQPAVSSGSNKHACAMISSVHTLPAAVGADLFMHVSEAASRGRCRFWPLHPLPNEASDFLLLHP